MVSTALVFSALVVVCTTGVHSSPLSALGVQGALTNSEKEIKPLQKPRILFIRSVPGFPGVQSDLFEIRHEPYLYDIRAVQAVAVIQGDGDSAIKGILEFTQSNPPVGPVMITGNVTGLTPGLHGFHIHQAGDMRSGCAKLGEHFNPHLLQHGGPQDPLRHLGDLGNVDAKEDGAAQVFHVDPLLSLTNGPRGIVGRSVVISKDMDDLGRAGTAESVTNGSSGEAIACGVIAYVR